MLLVGLVEWLAPRFFNLNITRYFKDSYAISFYLNILKLTNSRGNIFDPSHENMFTILNFPGLQSHNNLILPTPVLLIIRCIKVARTNKSRKRYKSFVFISEVYLQLRAWMNRLYQVTNCVNTRLKQDKKGDNYHFRVRAHSSYVQCHRLVLLWWTHSSVHDTRGVKRASGRVSRLSEQGQGDIGHCS